MKFAVVRTGGKQYLVRESDELYVDRLPGEVDSALELEKLAEGDDEKHTITLGKPVLKDSVKATIVENIKGDKLRVARFKAKVRSRKVTGFRQFLTKVKIVSL